MTGNMLSPTADRLLRTLGAVRLAARPLGRCQRLETWGLALLPVLWVRHRRADARRAPAGRRSVRSRRVMRTPSWTRLSRWRSVRPLQTSHSCTLSCRSCAPIAHAAQAPLCVRAWGASSNPVGAASRGSGAFHVQCARTAIHSYASPAFADTSTAFIWSDWRFLRRFAGRTSTRGHQE